MARHLTIPLGEYLALASGEKHFLLMRDITLPEIHYGDVLVMRYHGQAGHLLPLVRWVRSAESGLGLAEDWVCVVLAV